MKSIYCYKFHTEHPAPISQSLTATPATSANVSHKRSRLVLDDTGSGQKKAKLMMDEAEESAARLQNDFLRRDSEEKLRKEKEEEGR